MPSDVIGAFKTPALIEPTINGVPDDALPPSEGVNVGSGVYSMERQEVYAAIDSERDYQVSRAEAVSGPGSGEHKHSVEEFVLYMDDYMTELKHQLSRTWTPSGNAKDVPPALHTLRKVTALGVACMEQNGAPHREGF